MPRRARLGSSPIVRDVHLHRLRDHLARRGIARTVLVQAAATVEETEYMPGLADAANFVAKVVGWIDVEDQERNAPKWTRFGEAIPLQHTGDDRLF